ncbi:hypothetical protein ACQKWADRAFT_326874 [Trichoderma austrokoningii]
MDFFENKLSPCFERSTSRDSVPVKDKPSPLRIMRRQQTFKSNNVDAGADDSPLEDDEPQRTFKLPRHRPKFMSEKSTGHIPGQDISPPLPPGFRYPAATIRKLRQKRASIKNNLEHKDGHRISSTCTLPMEHSNTWLDDASRASSRCTYHGRRDSRGLAEVPFLPKPLLEEEAALVLSPHINVIPETTSMRAGQQHLWAAVEVCGRLFPADNRPENGGVVCSDKDTLLKFGHLYDLTIDVLPTTQSSIVQTICQQSFPSTLYAGSSILLLVQVALQPRAAVPSPRQHNHTRQMSEELMEDLQLQLGDLIIDYLSIQVSYSHSGFPFQRGAVGATEVSILQTRLVTAAEATITLHSVLSPWSPHPESAREGLLSVVESHWGGQKASEMMQQILAQRPSPAPKLKKIRSRGTEQTPTKEHSNYSRPPTIPLRFMSLHDDKPMALKSSPSLHSVQENRVSYDSAIGMKGAPSRETSGASKCGKEKDNGSSRGRWSVSPDATLRILSPALRNVSHGKDYKRSASKEKKQGAAGDVKAKKESGLWSWASWF